MRAATWAVLIALAVPPFAAHAQQTYRLNYKIASPTQREFGYVQGASLRLFDRTPRNPALYPATVAPKFWHSRFLDGRLVIVDKSKPQSSWDILWIDVNNDGKLDPKERFSLKGESDTGMGGALVPIEIKGDDGPVIQHFYFTLGSGDMAEGYSLTYYSVGYYTGNVKFGGKTYRVAVVDSNANGRFDDACAVRTPGDLFCIDYNNDGRYDQGASRGRGEIGYVAKYVLVDGKLYELEVFADGSTIVVTPMTVGAGTLQPNQPAVTLSLTSTNGWFTLERVQGNDPFPLAPGMYRIESVMITKKDDRGVTWYLRADTSRTHPEFEITADEQTAISLGAPLFATATVQQEAKTRSATVTLELTGTDGIPYIPMRGPGYEDVGDPAVVLVKSKDGVWQKRYTVPFQPYGGAAITIYAPANVKGPLLITPQVKAGPFEVQAETAEFTFE